MAINVVEAKPAVVGAASGLKLRAFADCDHAYIVWQAAERIPGCRGFALYRKRAVTETPVETWVGFEGQQAPPGTVKPSTEWPIQRFMWSDYMVQPGDEVQYRVVPVLGSASNLQPALDQASEWTPPITVSADLGGTSAYFNRGIVATQWLARRLAATPGAPGTSLQTIIQTIGDPTREFLGGQLLVAMRALLAQALADDNQLYAVLFELNDAELINGLLALKDRANIVLANGSQQPNQPDENAAARAELRQAGVNVFDRMVPKGTLAHNKFAIVCRASGEPISAWTGSTNWTNTGLCTQANNGILFTDPDVVKAFRDQWDLLKAAGSAFPEDLVSANSAQKAFTSGQTKTTVWFTRVRDEVDLDDAKALIDQAKHGILFLMFNPGPRGTLLNDIVERNAPGSASYDANLYVHGVLNQDPSPKGEPIIGLFKRGQRYDAGYQVALPEAIDQRLDYWIPELLKLPHAHAMVHSKLIVLDPFGDHPVVMTGSHNMGPKASGVNDDNLVIVENDPALAAAYAVNVMGVFDQYWWRFQRVQRKQAGKPDDWTGLQDNDTWQDEYFTGSKLGELQFWLG